jgi:hypothetical protein
MSSNNANDRKRKPTMIPETVSSNDERNPKEGSKKARRASTNAPVSTAASLQVDTPVATENAATATTVPSAAEKQEEAIESIGVLIQDLFHSDNAKVNAALDTLYLDLYIDKNKCENIHAV